MNIGCGFDWILDLIFLKLLIQFLLEFFTEFIKSLFQMFFLINEQIINERKFS